MKRVAKDTIDIEPSLSFHAGLEEYGHRTYEYCYSLLKDLPNSADIVTSFEVIEHAEKL